MELFKKYRPAIFKDVIGQPDAVRILKGLVEKNKVPRAVLFTGPSGCGKTTLARILKGKLECSDSNFYEVNAADFNGIEMVRDIRRRMNHAPVGSKCRIWLLDECQDMTKAAQNSFLKMLEDTPKHVYFMLATTDPAKLLTTIKTRCTEIKCASLSNKDLTKLIEETAAKEKVELSEEVTEKLVDAAECSARKAMVLLHQILEIPNEEDQLTAISTSASNQDAIELARLLCRKNVTWKEVANMIKKIAPTDGDVEGIRRMVLSYYNNILLGGGQLTERAFLVLDSFRDNYYDTGKVGLSLSCYEVVVGGK